MGRGVGREARGGVPRPLDRLALDGIWLSLDHLIGEWSDGTSIADRSIVRVELRHNEPRGMTAIDPLNETVSPFSSLSANALPRDKVIGQPTATDVFDIGDAISTQDSRVIVASGNAAQIGRANAPRLTACNPACASGDA